MSSAFLMLWCLAVLGTVWAENKKMVVLRTLKCARNNREILAAVGSTQRRAHSSNHCQVVAQLE